MTGVKNCTNDELGKVYWALGREECRKVFEDFLKVKLGRLDELVSNIKFPIKEPVKPEISDLLDPKSTFSIVVFHTECNGLQTTRFLPSITLVEK